jgi:hypothetical protein
MDVQSLLHANKNVKVVCDLSGNQSHEELTIQGILQEDAEVVDLEGDETIKLVVQCADLFVVRCIVRPTKRDAILGQFKKGVAVQLSGLFTPTNFERHEGTDILKPFGGMMVVTNWRVQPLKP